MNTKPIPVTSQQRDAFLSYEDESRIWIHPLFKELEWADDIVWVKSCLKKMVDHWTFHNQSVPGNFLIHRKRFVIIVNSHKVSGCGIDSSFRVISEINRYLGGEPGAMIYYLEGDRVHSLPRYQLRSAIALKKITPETSIVNLQLTRLRELRSGLLEVPAKKSFLADYFGTDT